MQPNRAQAHQSAPYYTSYAGHPSAGSVAAHALNAALSNPYGQVQSAHPEASHYAQAYAQYYSQAGPSTVTAEGYTLSSTYVPGIQYNVIQNTQPSVGQRAQNHSHGGGGQSPGGWYQPGNCRCSKQGCSFTGSKKTVEIHMMDRHLIFPPGWEHRKRKNDWDADPSLQGKPIPIQGTSIRLDTPETIAAWIAERKKRYPTAQAVAEKEQKKREAAERGQLPFDDGNRRKRRRTDEGTGGQPGFSRGRGGRGGHRGRGWGRGRGRGADSGWGGRRPTEQPAAAVTSPAVAATQPTADGPVVAMGQDGEASGEDVDSASDSDSDGAPEIISSKAPTGVSTAVTDDISLEAAEAEDEEAVIVPDSQSNPTPQAFKKPRPKQPRKPPRNPFTQRPSLLRNLLLPEIRMTVSNLSQAIRFLVVNDFLDGVELKPGQAGERKIEVIGEQPAFADTANATSAVPQVGSVPEGTEE